MPSCVEHLGQLLEPRRASAAARPAAARGTLAPHPRAAVDRRARRGRARSAAAYALKRPGPQPIRAARRRAARRAAASTPSRRRRGCRAGRRRRRTPRRRGPTRTRRRSARAGRASRRHSVAHAVGVGRHEPQLGAARERLPHPHPLHDTERLGRRRHLADHLTPPRLGRQRDRLPHAAPAGPRARRRARSGRGGRRRPYANICSHHRAGWIAILVQPATTALMQAGRSTDPAPPRAQGQTRREAGTQSFGTRLRVGRAATQSQTRAHARPMEAAVPKRLNEERASR